MRFQVGHKSWLGKKHSNETRAKISDTLRAKNIKPPSRLGTTHPVSEKTKLILSIKVSGNLNGHWKGDKVKYRALHSWVTRKLGRPKKCEHCGTIEAKRYEWANRSHKYKRELTDWIRLCSRCHQRYDKSKNQTDGHPIL